MLLGWVLVLVLTGGVSGEGGGLLEKEERDMEFLARVSTLMSSFNFTLPAYMDGMRFHALPPVETLLNGEAIAWHSLTIAELHCLRDIKDVVDGLLGFQTWAVQMIDSATKLQSGILQGNFVDLGQFDECIPIERPNYVGQHCLITLILGQTNATSGSYSQLGSMTLAQCFPSTCSNKIIAKILNTVLMPFNSALPAGARMDALVQETDCHTKYKSALKTEDWVVTAICCFIIGIAIISTSLDVLLLRGKGSEPTRTEVVMKSFSVYSNGKKLFGTKSKGDEMGAINGIKFLSMAWVVLGHKYLFKMEQPLVNPIRVITMFTQWTKLLILNATVSVDTFFMMSGLLNAYGFFTIVDKKKKFTITDLIISYIHRFIRLSPPYIIMMAITGTILIRFGDGPIWDRVVGGARQDCQTNWWKNILYVNNYLDGTCLMQSWYLGADMQMFWLAPIVLYPMWRWPVFGMIELVVLTAGSIASPFAVSYMYGWTSPLPNSEDQSQSALQMKTLYLPTHTRLISYIVGIFTGYILQKVRTGQKTIKFNGMMYLFGWLVAGVLLLYSVFGGYWFFQPNNPYNQLADSFYLAFFRFLWVLGIGWVIFACVTGHGGIVNRILSMKIFWPLGRLSYCTYLTHAAVLTIKTGLARTAVHFNDFDVVEEYIGDLFFIICTAVVLSLLLEAPTLVLEKLVLGTNRRPTPKSDPEREKESIYETQRNAGGEKLNY